MAPTSSYAASRTTGLQARRGHWLAALVVLLCATLTNQWPAQWSVSLPDHSGPRTEQLHSSADTALPRASLHLRWLTQLNSHDGHPLADAGDSPALSLWAALLTPTRTTLLLPALPEGHTDRRQALGKGPRHPHAPPALS